MKAIQLRMARAAIGWGVRELAEKAGVTANTVTRIENGADAKQSTIDALQRALEAAGIEFTNGDQPGLRLTKAAAARLPGSSQSRRVAAKVVRRKTAKAAVQITLAPLPRFFGDVFVGRQPPSPLLGVGISPRRSARLLYLQDQLARLEDQFSNLPAFRNSLTRIAAML